MKAKKSKGTSESMIGAAECAARTGLSVRALHVYEQRKLIKPFRTANGWRRYGAEDLSRLNTIIVLKSLGLKLSEIRAQLSVHSPSLEESLRIQLDAWRAKMTMAEAAVDLVSGALTHFKENRALPIDQLCALVRMFEMNTIVPDWKRRIAATVKPDESKLWAEWWAGHPDDLAASSRYEQAQGAFFRDLKAAMDSGAKVESTKVQTLMAYWETLFLRYCVRERTMSQLRWNYAVTFKWYTAAHRNRAADPEFSEQAGIYSPAFANFLSKAHECSKHGRGINAALRTIIILVGEGESPVSRRARQVAKDFAKVCSKHSLGDPLIYAQFARFIEQVNGGNEASLAKENAWLFLQQAIEVSSAMAPSGKPTLRLRRFSDSESRSVR